MDSACRCTQAPSHPIASVGQVVAAGNDPERQVPGSLAWRCWRPGSRRTCCGGRICTATIVRCRSGQTPYFYRQAVGLRARRRAIQRPRIPAASSPLFPGSQGGASGPAPRPLRRHPAGGSPRRVQRAVCRGTQAGRSGRGRMPGRFRRHHSVGSAKPMAYGRRKPFELVEVSRTPLAVEMVRRIDAIFDVERDAETACPSSSGGSEGRNGSHPS